MHAIHCIKLVVLVIQVLQTHNNRVFNETIFSVLSLFFVEISDQSNTINDSSVVIRKREDFYFLSRQKHDCMIVSIYHTIIQSCF